MLTPRHPPDPLTVARHYDELGALYRQLWSDRLHHGMWDDPAQDQSVAKATERLLEAIVTPLHLPPGARVVDIGCGYGAPARWMAATRGVHVTGLTVSREQAAFAQSQSPPSNGTVTIEQGDWLDRRYPHRSFDAAVAIESLAHMPDQAGFFRKLAHTLVPGGKAALATWMAAPDPGPVERLLLQSLCRDGRLAALATLEELRSLAAMAGLRLNSHRDLTPQVAPTWSIITRRAIRVVRSDRRLVWSAVRCLLHRPGLITTLPKMLLANRTGALRYGVLWLESLGGGEEELGSSQPKENRGNRS